MGGQEHATLHLLYARFWHKVLFDLGIVDHSEPFVKMVHQGMILGDKGVKMSKSLGNVVNPDDVVKQYGADVLRLYEMYMGPLEDTKPWNTQHVAGSSRFRNKLYALFVDREWSSAVAPTKEQLQMMHRHIKKITGDIQEMKFNVVVTELIKYTSAVKDVKGVIPKVLLTNLALLVSPLAPHLGEECWSILGNKHSLAYEAWPAYDEKYCSDLLCNITISVNGKNVKGAMLVDVEKSLAQEDALNQARSIESVAALIGGRKIKSVIFIPGRMINIIPEE